MKRWKMFASLTGGLALAMFLSFSFLPYPALGGDDIAAYPSCPYCGMDRAKFAHSRMLLEYENGTSTGLCSLHCAVLDMALKLDQAPSKIWVADYRTHVLIDAEAATWVIGGEKPGVMTRRAKWAFKERQQAEEFIKEFGGNLATFDEAVQASFEDMAKDTQMIREKRKMKMKKAQ